MAMPKPILIQGCEHDVVSAIEVLAKQIQYLAELPVGDLSDELLELEWDRLLAEARGLRDQIERRILEEHAQALEPPEHARSNRHAKSRAVAMRARVERLTRESSLAAVDMRLGQVILSYGRTYEQHAREAGQRASGRVH
jgi:hypothetical protein